ncbi:MAG: putative bifunctional diguanylate cyclase/phosphodiesterase [Sulfuricurvum sp.]
MVVFNNNDYLDELSTEEKRLIRDEQVKIAYNQILPSIVPLFIGGAAIVYFYSDTAVKEYVFLWFAIVCLTLLWRIFLVFQFRKRSILSTIDWEYQFNLMMLVSAFTWGISALFINASLNPFDQLFLMFMLAGIGSVASGTLASLPSLVSAFLVMLIAPMFFTIIGIGGDEHYVMAGMIAAFLLLLIIASKRVYINIVNALKSKLLHQKATDALALSEEHFETIFKDAPAGIFYYNTDLMIIDSNAEMMNILRIDRNMMIGLDLKALPDSSLYMALSNPIGGHKGYYEGPYKTRFMGLDLWIVLQTSPIYDMKRNIIGGVAIVNDVTDRIMAEEKMKHQAYFDALTDIPNRILLKDRIEQALAMYRRTRNLLAILFLDLDHFKSVNDSLGHHVGDMLLIETAERLKRVCREGDTVARLGGDEFIILLGQLGTDPHSAASHAESVAEKIHQALAVPFVLESNDPIATTSSIGIAIVSSKEQNADDLLKYADTAMYQAKKEGRHTTRFYQEQMDQWIKKRLYMENGLRHAIKNGELELYYQPVIEIDTQRIIGAEALLRWNHPELGLIMPDEIIDIAEESGLIVSIGEWVIQRACLQLLEWNSGRLEDEKIQRIAINVSAIQFRQREFVERVIAIIAESGIDPSMVEIELTESIIIDSIDTVIEKMEKLRAFGIGISMDDFGTGYSSLAYLKRLPFTTLKIDRSFIRDIMSDNDDAALVETILSIALIFNLDVIAEGVETIEQFEFLHRHQCRYFQGYLCSKPIRAANFELLLENDVQRCQAL